MVMSSEDFDFLRSAIAVEIRSLYRTRVCEFLNTSYVVVLSIKVDRMGLGAT
jgi:hypothetical protein